jgi:hypothetical protein
MHGHFPAFVIPVLFLDRLLLDPNWARGVGWSYSREKKITSAPPQKDHAVMLRMDDTISHSISYTNNKLYYTDKERKKVQNRATFHIL